MLILFLVARERVPRFLFRVFGDKSGGGSRGLNGKHGITPHGFLPEDQRLGHHRRYCVCMRNERSTAFTMTEADFSDMVLNHISGEPDPDTESSSWGASLEVVFWFQDFSVQQRPKSLHLATLDTWAFPDNEVFDVHQLWRAGLIWDCNPPEQTAEYLVHGRINVGVPGYGYYCRRIDDLKSFQLDPLLIKCLSYDSKWPHHGSTLYGKRRRNRNASAETLRQHTRSAVKVASAMLNGFSSPDVDAALIYMVAALLGVRFGREDRWEGRQVDTMYRAIMCAVGRPLQIVPDFFEEALWLHHGVIYCNNYPEIQRLLHFLNDFAYKMEWPDEAYDPAIPDLTSELANLRLP